MQFINDKKIKMLPAQKKKEDSEDFVLGHKAIKDSTRLFL